MVMHMLRCDSHIFDIFGEIYFSIVNSTAVKAWKLHKKMTINLAVPLGSIRLVLYDDRPDSPTRRKIQELVVGEDNYSLIKIPPMIWNGFQGLSKPKTIVANCATQPHDPEEIDRLDAFDPSIPYDWEIKHR